MEEIVVTAQKRSESLQEVPIAVTALTGQTRDLVGIQTIQDMTNFTPGITYTASLDRMFVRGIGRSTNNLSIDPAVATYRDGFYSSFNTTANSSTMFVQQVELLRGPQGTLYGRNAIGGALNLTSVRPTKEFEGQFRTDIGSYLEKTAEATVSGPITDWLRYRMTAGSYRQDKGFFQSTQGHANDGYGLKDNLEFEGQLAANIGDSVDLWFKFNHAEVSEGYGTAVNRSDYVTNNTTVSCPNTTVPAIASIVCTGSLGPNALFNTGTGLNPANPQYTTARPSVIDPYTINNDTPNHDTTTGHHVYELEAIAHLGFADLKYVGGYQEYVYNLLTDFDGSTRGSYVYTPVLPPPAPGNPPTAANGFPVTVFTQINSHYKEDKHYYSNEINLISTADSALKYVFGLYQYHERFYQPVLIGTDGLQPQLVHPLALPTFTPAAANLTDDPYYVAQRTMAQSEAAYGELDWDITQALRWTVGLRYSQDRRVSNEYVREVFWDPTLNGALSPALDITNSVTGGRGTLLPDGTYTRRLGIRSHATTGTFGFQWKPAQDTMGYFKYSRGYKESGINSGAAITTNAYTDPEYVNAYELGWKQTIASQFIVDAALFYNDYQGAQYPLTLIPGGSGPQQPLAQTAFFNINEKIYGAEFETHWTPIDDLTLWINYSYLHAVFADSRSFYDAITKAYVPLDGDTVPASPKNKASFNAVYTFHFSPGSLSLSGSYSWRDQVASSAFNDPGFLAPAYGIADARVTWIDTANKYSIIGYIRNATNKLAFDYVSIANTASGLTTTQSILPPRQVGMQFQYRFGGAAAGK